METPSSSSRTITRSQTLAIEANNTLPISSRKTEESEKGFLKSRERSVLIDITNDSPIVGLAIGNLKTPSSTLSKKRMVIHPGSGEALLRGQVKNLLQKVEEEAFISKISFEPRNLIHKQDNFVNSPLFVHAPTPFNTPQVSENDNNESDTLNVSSVEESFSFLQMLDHQEESEESNLKTRSLFMDSSEDEDDASVWSVEVNASTSDEHEDNDEEFKENYEDGEMDEVCEVISKISVNGNGKHTRFVYDIDGELEEEEVEEDEDDALVWSIEVNASTSDEHEDDDEEFQENYEDEEMDEVCEVISKISVNGNGKHTRFVYDIDGELEEEEVEEFEPSSRP